MTEDARLARTAPSLHLTAAVPLRMFGKILAAENSAGGPRVRVPGSCKAQSRCFHCTCGTRQVPELGSSQTSSVPSDRENLVPSTRFFVCLFVCLFCRTVFHYLLTGNTYTEESFDTMMFSLTVNPICCRQILTSWEGQSSKIQ